MKLHINYLKKSVIGMIALLCVSYVGYSQVYNSPGGTINTCSGTFYDTGGPSNPYLDGQNITTTFCSNAGNCVQLAFTSFALENNFDFIYIYDGPNAASPLIGQYTGGNSPGTVVSTTGCITVRFTSDGSVTAAGWAASISCVACPPPPPPVCSGTFFDSGGSGGDYGNSENTTTTFCANPGECMELSFTSFALENGFDNLYIYDGPSAASPLIGQYTGTASPGVVTSSSGCMTIVFTSDGSVTAAGWAANIACVTTCAPPPPPPPTNVNCDIPDPICSGSPIVFTAQANGTDADIVNPGNNYNCLFTSPNPSWYYLEIASGGNLAIDITAGSDVDFAIWGPFTNLANAVANCNSYGVSEDCSYSTSATEQANVNGVVAGEVYVLLVTNYANTVQTITLTDAGTNTATTDCTIVPLSVELTDFNGVNVDNEILLSWTTASEQNNSHFVVERSSDASIWSAIAVENGAGTTTSSQYYSTVDRNPSNGDNYYRLKQFDFDGKMTISDIISVSSSLINKVIVYPNPANDRVSVISNHEIIAISVVDIRGTVVYSENFNKVNSTSIELSDLNGGLYYLQTETTSGKTTERIVVQH